MARANSAHNLRPFYLTSFVGRAGDLPRLSKALASHRLVTLIGPGGVGKTRIATELVARSSDHWPDGVCWVDLAPVDDPDRLVETVAIALRLERSGDPASRIVAWLESKAMLLILDNCEHLAEACARFCEFALASEAGWHILATSRQPLRVDGELRFPVSPLSRLEATSLFEQRAALVVPSFNLGANNLEIVAEICRRVDELPLAIELLAARANVMTEEELLSRIEGRSGPVFASRSRDPRHVTLQATIDWSYGLLSGPEATLFRRLAVFRGGFGIESVRSVCAAGIEPDLLKTLAGLVDKSMVVVSDVLDGSTRYRLLESQMEYAEAKLRESGEGHEVAKRHYEYFRDELMARSNAIWVRPIPAWKEVTPADNRWKQRERDNMWSALKWARDNTDDMGMPMAITFAQATYGDIKRKREWMDDLLARGPNLGATTSWALGAAAGLAWAAREPEASIAYCEKRLQLLAIEHDPIEEAFTLSMIGNAKQELGHPADARAMHETALQIALEFDSPELATTVMNNLGCLELDQGDFAKALTLLTKAVAMDDHVSGPMGRANHIESLANAQLGSGDVTGAERSWRQSIELMVSSDSEEEAIVAIGGLARAAAARGDYKRAVRLASAHERLSREYSYFEQHFWADQLAQCIELARAKLGNAYGEAWAEGQALPITQAIAYALGDVAPTRVVGPLTGREAEVLHLVARGLSNRDVASSLFLSERTVEGHLDRIRSKLGIRSRVELGAWAVAHGLGSVNPGAGTVAGAQSQGPNTSG